MSRGMLQDAAAEPNPYAAPTSRVDDVLPSAGSEAEAIRKAHITHETSTRSIGLLHYLSAAGILFGAAAIAIPEFSRPTSDAGTWLGLIVMLALGVGLLFVGHGIRQLKSWVRIPAVLLSIIGLIGFPIGTLINGYILWLILGKKGRMVFSDEYQAVIAATPHVKYKTSIVVWILLGVIVLVVGAAFLATLWK